MSGSQGAGRWQHRPSCRPSENMKSWRERKVFSAPVLLAVGALVAAISIAGGSLYAHRTEMQFNLLAELAGVLFEVAVVVLIVDWLVERRDRQRWRHAYPMISDRLATAFVDAMRLLYVGSSKEAGYADDLSRYPAFHTRLSRNLEVLRSTIEGFAVAIESSAHYAVRDMELKLRWLHDRLERPVARPEREFGVALEVAEEFDRFCTETWPSDYGPLKASVLAVVHRVAPQVLEPQVKLQRSIVLNLRYRLQNDILDSEFRTERPVGAFFDHRQETSMHYFIIDLILLPHHVELRNHDA